MDKKKITPREAIGRLAMSNQWLLAHVKRMGKVEVVCPECIVHTTQRGMAMHVDGPLCKACSGEGVVTLSKLAEYQQPLPKPCEPSNLEETTPPSEMED